MVVRWRIGLDIRLLFRVFDLARVYEVLDMIFQDLAVICIVARHLVEVAVKVGIGARW